MSVYSTRPITLTNLHTYPLSSRKSKVNVRDFAKPPAVNPSLSKFLASLPNFLAAADLRNLLGAIAFGMAAETGEYLNQIAKVAMRARLGYGEAAGQFLHNAVIDVPYANSSVLAAAYRLRVPVTIHLAIGTDIPHMHRTADGAALGSATHLDFRLFCSLVEQMHPGGIYLNWGSAVLLPEVFLKAVSVVRNLGVPLRPITTANFDFIQHYRPLQNVVRRPTASDRSRKGEESHGYAITGHHELLLPLVAAALASGWPRPSPPKKANKVR